MKVVRVKHYNVSSSAEHFETGATGKPRVIPPSVRRALAKNSTSGGRATCHYCRETFTVTYLRLVRMGNFHPSEWACQDCIRERSLVVA